MANEKISAMPAASALTGVEALPLVQAGGNVQTPVSALMALAAGAAGTQLLEPFDLTGQASLIVTDLSAAYCGYLVKLVNAQCGTNNANFLLNFSTDNGVTFDTTANHYAYAENVTQETGVNNVISDATATFILLANGQNDPAGFSCDINIVNPSDATCQKQVSWIGANLKSSAIQSVTGAGRRKVVSAVNALRIKPSAGVFATGSAYVYGIRKASGGAGAAREVLSGARAYYVRTNGSDANTGLANTAAGAFLTIQHAVNIVSQTLDLGDDAANVVTIHVADGAYQETVYMPPLVGYAGVPVNIIGNSATPTNVVWSAAVGGVGCASAVGANAAYKVDGFKLDGTTGTDFVNIISASEGALLQLGALYVKSAGGRTGIAATRATILANQNENLTFEGAFSSAIFAYGSNLDIEANNLTLVGGPTWTYFIYAAASYVLFYYNALAGAGVGARANIVDGAVVDTFNSGANFIPGNAPITFDGGQYDALVSSLITQTASLQLAGTGAATIAGNAVLVGGTVDIATTAVTANSLIQITRKTIGGAAGNLSYVLTTPGVKFTINSSNIADTSTVTWQIVEPF